MIIETPEYEVEIALGSFVYFAKSENGKVKRERYIEWEHLKQDEETEIRNISVESIISSLESILIPPGSPDCVVSKS